MEETRCEMAKEAEEAEAAEEEEEEEEEEDETGGEVDKEDGYSTRSLPMDCGTRNMDRASLSTDSSDAPGGGWGLWGLGGGNNQLPE